MAESTDERREETSEASGELLVSLPKGEVRVCVGVARTSAHGAGEKGRDARR